MYAKEAFANKLDVANMEGILNRILSYAPVTKNELYFARTQLEWLLGDEINLGDDSMTESEDSSDEDEASQEMSIMREHLMMNFLQKFSQTIPLANPPRSVSLQAMATTRKVF